MAVGRVEKPQRRTAAWNLGHAVGLGDPTSFFGEFCRSYLVAVEGLAPQRAQGGMRADHTERTQSGRLA